jgi:hypothetical protein
MPGGHLNANVEQYLQAAAMNTAPPLIASDPLVTGTAPIEQVLRMLGLAANSSDAQDNSDGATENERREALATEAAEMFAAQDDEATVGLDGVAAGDQRAAMTQQLPQAAAGIAAALAGALGGALQPLAQIPQQIAQGAQQVLQSMGSSGDPVGDGAALLDDPGLGPEPWLDEFDSTADDVADFGGVGGADIGFGPTIAGGTSGGSGGSGGPAGTLAATTLGPPPVPPASTAPSSAPSTPVPAPKAPAVGTTHSPGIAGMPMVPPGAVGAAAVADKYSKPDTKRVSVPPVRNGAPVQGRLIPGPALPPVTRKLTGRPVTTRRIATPEGKTDGDRPVADPKPES